MCIYSHNPIEVVVNLSSVTTLLLHDTISNHEEHDNNSWA